jgi:hypothetical protein
MYVRVVGSPAQDTFGTGEDEAADRRGAGGWGGGSVRDGFAGVAERVQAARAVFDRPLTSYYVIVGITTLLLCLGLVMVLSTASWVDLSNGKSAYHDFEWQLVGIAVGLPIMWLFARGSFAAWLIRCSRCRSSGSA